MFYGLIVISWPETVIYLITRLHIELILLKLGPTTKKKWSGFLGSGTVSAKCALVVNLMLLQPSYLAAALHGSGRKRQ